MSTQPPAPLPATTDVLIVGAGPVGLTLAAALTARGADAVLLDRRAEGANTSRAAVVHARTLEVLEDIGVSDELVGRGVIVPRFTVRDGDRALLTVDFDGLPTRYPYTLMVPQDVTEEVLAARLRAAGGAVHRGREVVSLVQDEDGVTATTSTGETVRARYAVGADGMHSTVRELAGIGFAGAGYAQSFVLADVRLDWGLRPDEVQLFFAPAGLVVVAPLPGGRHRIVATMDDAPEHPALADVQALLDARGPRRRPGRVTEVVWSSRFRVHHRLADRYRAGRVLLAGDAAHVHSPAGGQGMNTGVQDAVALASRLAAVLAGDAPEASLDAYEAERRPVAEGVVAMTDRMTRAATANGAAARRVRNALLRVLDRVPAARRRMAMRLSELTAAEPRR
ncbi:FAD-dependent monooxygenase [Actinomadura chibensis]|uniref:FAD-dependent oxidoreductase n=1 Tax=Actinomadura chibensis TaxID=392828 RepID=A0A5D0NJT6_9ACTN|nr:FAD-dependent monooxygenase [Actinomadura chibensis]TYB44703.1 FAD-dependent oxidoreductase [Actinomadura chibensis]